MQFKQAAPQNVKLTLGKGYFLVNTDNPVIARLLSQNFLDNHSKIIQKKCESLSVQDAAIISSSTDIVAVFDKAERDQRGWSKVYFDYYVV